MTVADDILQHVPDIAVDLTGCGRIGVHGLPPPVVVTLERRPDRWAHALANLALRGIAGAIRATAIDGQKLTSAQFGQLLADPTAVERPLDEYLQLTRPAVGCFLSHLALWKRFLATNEPYIFIIEDDAHPADGFSPERARAVMEQMPDNTDILLLGGTTMDGLAEPTDHPTLSRMYYYNGTFAYLLTRRGCLSLLPRLLPLKTHIDNQISLELVADRTSLHVYSVEPRLFAHDFAVYSDVYIPVTDTAAADRKLAPVFETARESLTRAGARLYARYKP
jgi:glycosyl transferase, family 25